MSSLILIRHGESVANVLNHERRFFCGQADTPLTARGKEQAKAVGKTLATMTNIHVELAITSTLSRSKDTATIALSELPYDVPLQMSDAFRERSLGIFEGRFADEVFADYPEYKEDPDYREFFLHFNQKAPQGENLSEVTERVRQKMIEVESECKGDVVIFSHSTTIRCLLGHLLSLKPEQVTNLNIPNASPIILKGPQPYVLVQGITID